MADLPGLFCKPGKSFKFPENLQAFKSKTTGQAYKHGTAIHHQSLTLLHQYVPSPGTVHSTEQLLLRVPGTEVPHIYIGHETHVYIQLVEPEKPGLSPWQV